MNIFLIILLVIAGVVALLLIIAAFSKKGYAIQRSIVIDKPVDEVYNYLRHIRNQDHFSKWVMTDPQMKKTFTGADGTVGFIYAWDGNKKAGKGEQEIKKLTTNKEIQLEVRFERPFKAVATTPFILESEAGNSNQTIVKWGMKSAMPWPMNAAMLFMNIENMLAKDLEISLGNLKRIIEQG
ncbi:MAG: SRPBCC family protein [Chitinophagaceae bacterium]|nr:SRPBCC family protein [Chitinophagaceae bacterium]